MASESAIKALNGNHGNHPHGGHDQSGSPNHTTAAANGSTLSTVGHNSASAANNNSKVPKDEVGWYFVEQYYTTLSKTPEKIHVRCVLKNIRLVSPLTTF